MKPQIQRDKKGRIIKGIAQDTNKNGTAGRPCEYCKNKEGLQKIAVDYFERYKNPNDKKIQTPFIEELALELDIDDSTLVSWANKKNEDKLEHPEFHTIYTNVKNLQKLRLKQRALGRFNPNGPLTLLRFDHGAMETSKKIIAGSDNEPLEIRIVEDNYLKDEE